MVLAIIFDKKNAQVKKTESISKHEWRMDSICNRLMGKTFKHECLKARHMKRLW